MQKTNKQYIVTKRDLMITQKCAFRYLLHVYLSVDFFGVVYMCHGENN